MDDNSNATKIKLTGYWISS